MAKPRHENKVDFYLLESKRIANGLTQRDVGVLINKSTGFYNLAKKRGTVDDETLEALSKLFGIDEGKLLVIDSANDDETIEEIVEVDADGPIVEEVPVVDINDKIDALSCKVDKLIELLSALSDPKCNVVGFDKPKSRHEIAQDTLRTLIEEGGGMCRKSKFVELLLKEGIGTSYAKSAISDCGYEEAVVGFGQNSTTWILDTVG